MRSELEENLLRETIDIFSRAVATGVSDAVNDGDDMPRDEFLYQLKHNVEVFSAFRTHRMQNDIAAQLTDDEGKLRTFSQFRKAVEGYTDHQNRAWLRTEYDTAVRRAHQAADWQQFEAEKDVLPNLEWIPSTSPTPGADHRVFWGTVLPVDDPFWKEHRPGDRWNCKCELRATDKDCTARPSGTEKDNPQSGLENNPGKDGHLFSDKHPYYPDSCASCQFSGNKLFALFSDLAGKKDCHHCGKVSKSIERAERKIREKNRLENLTPKTNYEAFKKAQHSALEYLREKGLAEYQHKGLYTGTLYFGKREIKRIRDHLYTGLEIDAARHLHTLLRKIKNGKYLPIDMSRKNYKLKINDGVLNYTSYEVFHRGEIFVIKCQVRRNGPKVTEYPYSIKQKKE